MKFLLGLCSLFLVSVAFAEVTPERVKAAAAELEKLTITEMSESGIPGIAIAVVYKDQVVFAKGFGVRVARQPDAVDPDTVFQLASVSKPVGSTVIAAVVGDGKVSWDSRISDLDPGFAMSEPWVTREITVRDFYAHRSGLPDHAGDLLEDVGFTRAEVLRRLRYQTPDSSFRSAYAYTNFGLTEGAVAVAKSLGKEWEDLSEERLYNPLGMASTSSRHADFLAHKNRASGHVQVDGQWLPKFQRDPDPQSPAGGVSSSVNDMAKWLRLQLTGGKFEGTALVDGAALAETHHPHIVTGFSPLTGLPGFYGLGWNVSYDTSGRLRLSHSGAFDLGAATAVFLVPSEQLGLVILTNAAPIGVPEALGAIFLDHVLHGAPTADWLSVFKDAFARMREAESAQIADYSTRPSAPAPAAPFANYLGAYANDFFGTVKVHEQDGRLSIHVGPNAQSYPLSHWDRDVFTYPTESETLVGPSGVFFTMGPDGHAIGLTVENLNRLGEGTFLRQMEP